METCNSIYIYGWRCPILWCVGIPFQLGILQQCTISCRSKLENFPKKYMLLSSLLVFKNIHLPSSWLVSQVPSLSQHLAEQGFNTLAQIDNHGIMGYISFGKPMTTQPHQSSHVMISRRLSLLKN